MTYEELADAQRVKLCRACDRMNPTLHLSGRREGRVLHWSRVRVTKIGAYRFLRLAHAARIPPGAPVWKSVWLSNIRARESCEAMGMRIPRGYSEQDRAYVRYLLADPKVRSRNSEAKRAWKWATRTNTGTTSASETPSWDGSSGAPDAR